MRISGDFLQRLPDAGPNHRIELGPLVPGNRRFKRISHQSKTIGCACVHPNKGIPPTAYGATTTGRLAGTVVNQYIIVIDLALVIPGDGNGLINPRTLGYLGGLESNNQQRLFTIQTRRSTRRGADRLLLSLDPIMQARDE